MQVPRSLHSLTYTGHGRLVVYGGLGQLSAPLNDCWVLEVETETWREQELGYDHGEVRCWHSALLSTNQEVILHSGLTQEFYLTRTDLDDHCEDFLRLTFGTTTSLKKLALESVIKHCLASSADEDQVKEIIQSLPPMLKKAPTPLHCYYHDQ